MELQFENKQSLAITKLYDAALMGDVPSLHNVLQGDPRILDRCMIENSSRFMQSPLHVAAYIGHLEIVETLLAMMPEMCFTHDQYGRTPIHIASIYGHVEVLQRLLQVNFQAACERTYVGETYLHLCIKHGHTKALEKLLDLTDDGELLNAKDNNGNTVLHYAVRSKQHEMVKVILKDKRIKINAVNKDKLTAMDTHLLLTSSRKGDKSCFGKVLNWKADNEIGPTLEYAKALSAKDYALKIKHKDEWVERQSNGLMVAASLIATMAFTLGTSPPGGCWQDPDKIHDEGFPNAVGIIYTIYKNVTDALLIANEIALASSLSVILLLISGLPNGRPVVVILRATMLIAVTATTLTYAISIYLITNDDRVDTYTPYITLYIWASLVGSVILAHLLLLVVKFIIRRHTLRSRLIKCCQAVRGSPLPCLEC